MLKCTVLVVLALATAAMADIVTLHEARTALPGWSATTDAVDPKQHFRVTIGLKRRNEDVLLETVDRLSSPASPSYGKHLNHEQIRALIAPPQENIDIVLRWLSSYGIKPFRVDAHGDYITIVEPISTLSSLLATEFTVYAHEKGGRRVARALGAVRVPDIVAGVVELIAGVQGFPLLTAGPIKMKGKDIPDVTPKVIYDKYNITKQAPNSKIIQSLAQFQGQFVDPTDLTQFCTTYSHGQVCQIAKYIGQNLPGEPGIESSLDSEYIMAIAPGIETWVYSYPNFDFCADLLSWTSDVLGEGSSTHPSVISMSYGSQLIGFCTNDQETRLNTDMAKFGAIGITAVIASGDDGSGQWSRQGYNNGKLSPSFPASVNYALAVGATTFVSGNSGEEEATTQFGSGGGFDYTFKQADYQASFVTTYFQYLQAAHKVPTLQYAAGGRPSPDVSLLGEGFHVISGGSDIPVGGTSASTPTWAAIVSLLNTARANKGLPTLGHILPWIYSLPNNCFLDTTKGTNAIDPDTVGWIATKGWDAATGRGTPYFPCLLTEALKK